MHAHSASDRREERPRSHRDLRRSARMCEARRARRREKRAKRFSRVEVGRGMVGPIPGSRDAQGVAQEGVLMQPGPVGLSPVRMHNAEGFT